MASVMLNIAITLGAFFLMEGVAWFTHKYVMHGLLWILHKDHHRPNHHSVFERNDFFFLIFATPGITFFVLGMMGDFNALFWVGLGITLYGTAYFVVHDIFIHQRARFLTKSNSVYFRAIRKAHKVHHKHMGRHDGECFGMLWVPMRYFVEAKKASK